MEGLFRRTAVARKSALLLEVLYIEGPKTAHVHHSKGIALALGVGAVKIRVKRHIILIKMKHRPRGIVLIAGSLPVYVAVKIECILVTLEYVVE